MTRLLVVASLFAPLVAHAVPVGLTQQGRLLDAQGSPVNGAVSLVARLHDSASRRRAQCTGELGTRLLSGRSDSVESKYGVSSGLRHLCVGVDRRDDGAVSRHIRQRECDGELGRADQCRIL
ncbi:MAG: hypothetical protein ACJARS_003962, partial [bacterium]